MFKDLCKIKYENSPTDIVLDVKNTNLNEALRDYLSFDLKKAGIEADVIEENGFLIVTDDKETLKNQMPTVFEEQENYYFLFFEIAETFYSHMKIKSVVDDFRRRYAINIRGFELSESFVYETKDQIKTPSQLIFSKLLQRKLLYGALAFCCGFLMITAFLMFYDSEKSQKPQIRSDLIIPKDSALLQRDELLKQIDDKFNNQKGIKTVALIGPGGAGKTTLARQYAHEQKSNVIWEINAETHESLTSSFESLAQALVKIEGDKKTLKKILDIKDAEAKEGKVIQFVKEYLSSHSNWFLIFDNVEKFTDIQKYFPQDFATWGKGKVILTTRNSNIQNNEHINFTLSVGELLSHQKLHLFTQIMKNNSSSFTSKKIEEAKKFLENIPSFPLDISIAAYYLKETNISYKTYLENLENYNKDFVNIQETLLKEVGDYNKTRYGIITLSIQHLIDTHKDFKELLLFISLLDSQNIPRDLLNNFKNSSVVNNFIINLKKYSLITNEALASSINSTLTIHRSTQEIIFNYFIYNIHLRKDDKMVQQIVCSIENYIDNIIESEAVTLIQSMIKHCKKILSYNYLLTDNMVYSLKSKLGNMYYYSDASLNIEAKRILEDNIKYLKTHHIKNKNSINDLIYLGLIYSEMDEREKLKELADYTLVNYTKTLSEKTSKSAWALSFLGNMYDDLGDYECAKELLEKSCNLYKEYFSDDHVGRARSLAYLGNVYRKLGNYQYAKKVLEKSYEICKKNFSGNHFRTGWTLVALGNVYLYLGDYKKSTYLLTESVNIYKKYFPGSLGDACWPASYLGNSYIELGNYKKSRHLLEECLKIYQKDPSIFSEQHDSVARALSYLGKVYTNIKEYEKARILLEKSLIIYQGNFGKTHLETAYVLSSLGELDFSENKFNSAEEFFQKALEIFQTNKHPESYKTLESLADLYMKKSTDELNNGNLQKSKNLQIKATNHLKQALEVIKIHFPEDSPNLKRIQEKIKSYENG